MIIHLLTTHKQQMLLTLQQQAQNASDTNTADPVKPMNAFLSDLFGYLSFVCWLCVLLPQLWLNYKRKSSDGLSLGFILMWLAGDFTDWFGAYVGRLLLPAILIALYFVITDIVLLAQMFCYRKSDDDVFGVSQLPEGTEHPPLLVRRGRRAIKFSGPQNSLRRMQEYQEAERAALIERGIIEDFPQQQQHQQQHQQGERQQGYADHIGIGSYGAIIQSQGDSSTKRAVANNGGVGSIFARAIGRAMDPVYAMCAERTGRAVAISMLVLLFLLGLGVSARILLSYYPQRATDIVSQVFGYISAAMFFVAYIPQIAWNFTAQSTEGLSAGMFIFTVLGNVTYCLSIVSMSTERDYLIAYAPWLAGALGTLGFEMLVLWQCYFYSAPSDDTGSNRGGSSSSSSSNRRESGVSGTSGVSGNNNSGDGSNNDSATEDENDEDIESLLSYRKRRRSRRRRRYSKSVSALSRTRSEEGSGVDSPRTTLAE
ncbi:putative vacuolar membrane transporter for cationic amino acids [Coemansia asiatica]|nr:putative vacuolar membrane transporter for cationic amino acids [Coemansia asiatica]